MKLITLEDINNIILETDIEILNHINITDLNDVKSLYCYGVYVLNYKHKESYIGMSCLNKGFLKSRLSSYIKEVHQRNLIESINVFITNSYHAQLLEKIMIKTFKPELNNIMFNEYSFLDEYKIKYGNNIIKWLKKQNKRNDPVGDISRQLIEFQKNNIIIKNVIDYEKYIMMVTPITFKIGAYETVEISVFNILEALQDACNEHININKHLILDIDNIKQNNKTLNNKQ